MNTVLAGTSNRIRSTRFTAISAVVDRSSICVGKFSADLKTRFQNQRTKPTGLSDAKRKLTKLPSTAVVWDIDDRLAQPPWGMNIASTIASLGNYFVSSAGRDLFELLEEALSASAAENSDAVIG
jgi:hypothetical protein